MSDQPRAYKQFSYGALSRWSHVHPAQDHDGFGLNQSKAMNVMDSKHFARDAGGKPVTTFLHPARD
jgi:hypothetical protein